MGFFDTVLSYLVTFWDFLTYDMWVMFGEWFVLASVNSQIFFVKYSWSVAKSLLETLSISPLLEQSWNSLGSGTLYYLTFFRVPESLNIIIQAGITRFVIGRF